MKSKSTSQLSQFGRANLIETFAFGVSPSKAGLEFKEMLESSPGIALSVGREELLHREGRKATTSQSTEIEAHFEFQKMIIRKIVEKAPSSRANDALLSLDLAQFVARQNGLRLWALQAEHRSLDVPGCVEPEPPSPVKIEAADMSAIYADNLIASHRHYAGNCGPNAMRSHSFAIEGLRLSAAQAEPRTAQHYLHVAYAFAVHHRLERCEAHILRHLTLFKDDLFPTAKQLRNEIGKPSFDDKPHFLM